VQHIAAVYNIHPPAEGGLRITPSLRDSLQRLLHSHTLFGGRDAELKHLNAFVNERAKGYEFVTALSGYGKTALLANWVKMLERNGQRVCYHFFSRVYGKTAEEDFSLRNLCQQLTAYHDLRGGLPDNTSDLRALYPSLLAIPTPPDQKLVVVLDGLDEAQDWLGPELFPTPLPDGVFVVFSARKVADRNWLASLGLPQSNVDILELSTLGVTEITNLLRAAGDEASRWAEEDEFVSTMHKKSGGDPFYVHYLVTDIQDRVIKSLVDLANQPSGLKGYLDQWWREVSRAASETAVRDLIGYLLVAYGRLTRDDLTNISQEDALSGAVFERTIERVQRYVVGDEKDGYTFCHSRFRDYVSQERIKEAEQLPYRERLLEYCKRWPEHFSDYAIQYLVAHLVDSDDHEALWELLTKQDQEGRNVWYEAHVAARNSQIEAADRLRWYLDDIERAKKIFYRPDQSLLRSFELALLWSSVNSISDRVPTKLLGLMASLGESMASRAITLARRKVDPLHRARALVAIVTNLADFGVRKGLIAETLNVIAGCPPQWGRSIELKKLAPIVSCEYAQGAINIVLRSVASPHDVSAVGTLASKLPENEAVQVYDALWTAVHKIDDPINRAALLGEFSRLDIQHADEAAREAQKLNAVAVSDLGPEDRIDRKTLIELARSMAVSLEDILQMLGRFEPNEQANILTELLSEPVAIAVIPAINHLLTVEPSQERGKAFAAAIGQLDEDNVRRLVFGVEWNFQEFALIVSCLFEPLRSDAARNLIDYMLQEDPQFHKQAETLARIVPFLSEADRKRALEFIEACAQKVPLVPPEEEVGRQAASMLRISDRSGKPVQFEWSVSPSRADTLAILAQLAEGEQKRDYIEQSLRAAHAIGDPYETSLLLAELSKSCQDEEGTRLQFAALGFAKSIEWEGTRAETMVKIAKFLSPPVTDAAIAILGSFNEESLRKAVEAQLLVNRAQLSDQDIEHLKAALKDGDEDWRVALIQRLADKADQAQINGFVDGVLKWSDAAAARAITAFAHRLSSERALDLLTSRSWPLDVIEHLIRSLPPSEQGEPAQWMYNSVIKNSNPVLRALALSMLARLDVSSLDKDEIHKRLEEALEQISLDDSPDKLAFLAEELPTNSPYRTKFVAAVFDAKAAPDGIKNWDRVLHHLAKVAPAVLLLELLSSLEPLEVRDRIVSLRSLCDRIVDELPVPEQWDAWKELLRFTSGDSRRDLLAQLRSALPLIKGLTPESLLGAVADGVLRVQRSFP
jgi:hypothetical protein